MQVNGHEKKVDLKGSEYVAFALESYLYVCPRLSCIFWQSRSARFLSCVCVRATCHGTYSDRPLCSVLLRRVGQSIPESQRTIGCKPMLTWWLLWVAQQAGRRMLGKRTWCLTSFGGGTRISKFSDLSLSQRFRLQSFRQSQRKRCETHTAVSSFLSQKLIENGLNVNGN